MVSLRTGDTQSNALRPHITPFMQSRHDCSFSAIDYVTICRLRLNAAGTFDNKCLHSVKREDMKIDIFCHIFPEKFYQRMLTISERGSSMQKRIREIPSIVDLNLRFRQMD